MYIQESVFYMEILCLFYIFPGQQPRSCYILLGNLGLSNLLTGIAVLFGHYYPSRNDTSCAIQIGMFVVLLILIFFVWLFLFCVG